jgi:two-component system nitrogen regulation sensor histidine kinase GlnL
LISDSEIFEALSTAVLLVDDSLCIVRSNVAAQSLLAISAAKIHGALLAEVLPGADELVHAVSRALLEERPFTERGLDLRLGKHSTAVVDCSVTPLLAEGKTPARILIEMTNVERHQRIQIAGNMLLQNTASSALLQGLAHEIKNPLGGIRGAAQLLERELEDQRQAEYTQVIIGEVDRLRTLVDRMLGPRGESHRTMVNIHDVLEHVRLVADAERAGNVTVERDYDPSVPHVYVDRDQMIQAFLNLLRNAIQSINGNGGNVTLRTRVQRKFTIGATLHRLVVAVQIIDTGPGVDPELQTSIFLPLVSGHANGSGLGLPIAQSLVHRQAGLMAFESVPGHTEFTVWLPLGEAE